MGMGKMVRDSEEAICALGGARPIAANLILHSLYSSLDDLPR